MAAAIRPWDAREAADQQAVLDWIDSGAELYRQVAPAIPPRHLVSYFLLMDGPWILLVDHIKAGLWLPSGGHCDPGEHPRDTVRREVVEELSVEATFLQDAPVFLTLQTTTGHRDVVHEDVTFWYVLRGEAGRTYDYDRGEFHGIRWFAPQDVPLDRTDPNLTRCLAKLGAQEVR
jgi:8-oxo-dGTP pyrophosphatase MutT (NUDIX family)